MGADWGGAVSGAASGAAAGSSFGPIGTGIGAAVGGAMGMFGGKKKKKKPKAVSRFDKNQQQLNDDYIASLRGEGPFADLYNYDVDQANQVFDQKTGRPAYRAFEENVIPKITGQFRSNNLMNSSYTGQSLSRAGRDVQENLDALRADQNFRGQENAKGYKRDTIKDILDRTTFDYQDPSARAPSTIDRILDTVAEHGGQFMADYMKPSNNNNSSYVPPAPAGISGGRGYAVQYGGR